MRNLKQTAPLVPPISKRPPFKHRDNFSIIVYLSVEKACIKMSI